VSIVDDDRIDDDAGDNDAGEDAATSGPFSERRMWLIVLGIFFASRLIYYAMGVRFIAGEELRLLPQVLPLDMLRHDYFQSIWYLHAQPPLFNAIIGAVLNWSPLPDGLSFQLLFLATGATLALGLYDLARHLRLAPIPAAIVALVIACGPPVVWWENVLNYDFLVATILVWISVATARWVANGHTSSLAAIAALGAATVLLRSFMHPLVFVAILAIALVLRRPPAFTRGVVLALAIPLVLVGGTMLKNQVLFGSPDLSTWLGYNAKRVAVDPLPDDLEAKLRADGVINAPLFPPDCQMSRPDVPVLAQKFKAGIEPPTYNENWECLIDWRNDMTSDAIATAKHEPGWMVKSAFGSAEIWTAPSTFYWEGHQNKDNFHGLDTVYRRVVELDVPWSPPLDPKPPAWAAVYLRPDGNDHFSITAVVSTLLVIAGGIAAALTWRRRRSPARAALLMGSFLVTLATTINFVLGHDENNRLRFMVEPLTLVLAAGAVGAFIRWWRASRARQEQGASEPAEPLPAGVSNA
jgi:hypothetical protein